MYVSHQLMYVCAFSHVIFVFISSILYIYLLIDIRDHVSTEEVMESEGLGPNAGLLLAMSFFIRHHTNTFLDWLSESSESDFQYIFCDLPGY